MSQIFSDHFSGHAVEYAAARPHYPPAVFAWMASQCARRDVAWEPGCGNGQASAGLATHFSRVIATDPSAAQIAAAVAVTGVEFRVETAEHPALEPSSVDLVLVAQALHWFDQTRFHAAVQTVLRPAGVFVALAYGLLRIDHAIDAVIGNLYHHSLCQDWPAERSHIDDGYCALPFPYAPLRSPAFTMVHEWTLGQLVAYFATWSAVQRFRTRTGSDPLAEVVEQLAEVWGDPDFARPVTWELLLRAGRRQHG